MKIVVDTEKLVSTSDKVLSQADSYMSIANQLFNEVGSMGVAWNGKDNEAFVNQINGYRDNFEQLDKLLRQYAEMLLTVDKEYRETLRDSYTLACSIKECIYGSCEFFQPKIKT